MKDFFLELNLFKYSYEKEIVWYAYFKKLDYFSTECIYSPNAYRGHAREHLKELEKLRPSSIIDVIHAGEYLTFDDDIESKMATVTTCIRCGYMSSNKLCKACVLLEGLNKGMAKLAIGRTSKKLLDDAADKWELDRRDISQYKNLDF
jgi:cytoplasmic tRNA 2-thiolation protein 1